MHAFRNVKLVLVVLVVIPAIEKMPIKITIIDASCVLRNVLPATAALSVLTASMVIISAVINALNVLGIVTATAALSALAAGMVIISALMITI